MGPLLPSHRPRAATTKLPAVSLLLLCPELLPPRWLALLLLPAVSLLWLALLLLPGVLLLPAASLLPGEFGAWPLLRLALRPHKPLLWPALLLPAAWELRLRPELLRTRLRASPRALGLLGK